MELGPGTVVGGKYRIERPLAKGGMGSVWVARHAQLGATVAIKFLDASFAGSPAHRARFEREARASANLKSPHVVQVTDYGFEVDAPYLVMELLEGEDLAQRLRRVNRMSLRDTVKVLTQIGKALRKAHEAGIAHRDLKPANLFVACVDDEEVVKILDFGIAKEANSTLGDATKTGEVIGSPHYMSPEQVRADKSIDHRTDLWSLGVILYRMVTGDLPFPGDQLGPVLAKILTDPIPPVAQSAPDLPPSLDAFFQRAMARDPAYRFQSIGEMVEAFVGAAGGADAFPSISLSLGAGGAPASGGGTLVSPGPTGGATGPGSRSYGPLSGSAPQPALAGSGPHTGVATQGGLAHTGARPASKGIGAVVAIGAIVLTAVAATSAWFMLNRPSRSTDVAAPGPTPSATAEPAATAAPPAPASAAAAEPPSAASAEASAAPAEAPAPSETATATAAAPPKAEPPAKPAAKGGPKPASPPAKSKEKWF